MLPQSKIKNKKTNPAKASPVVFQRINEQPDAKIPQKFLNSIGFINYDQYGNPPWNDREAIEIFLSREYKSITNFLGIDCEMVGVGHLKISALGRVSIVNEYGYCIYDTFVDPVVEITDYRTKFSGIRPEDVESAPVLDVVLQHVAKLVSGKTLVGHSIHNDLEVLKLNDHPSIRDTAIYFKKLSKEKGTPSLKQLSKKYLKLDIQSGEHSSIQDAQATIMLYLLYRKQWEQKFSQWRNKANIVAEKIPLTEISDMHVEPREPDLFVESKSVFVRANKVLGAYASCEEYLDIQFRLLLEDFLRPLRQAVRTVNWRKKKSKMALYHGVRIVGGAGKGRTFEVKGKGTIMVPIEINKLKYWEEAKMFIPGSLLLLSNDNFKSVKFALITWVKPEDDCKDYYSLPIHVQYTKDGPTWIVNESDRFSMMESQAFFAAYKYTLEYLQVVNLNEFPMKKYIVDALTTPVVPSHLQNSNETIEFSVLMKNGASHKSKPLEMFNWPTTAELNLDSTQYAALKKALTQELTIIQGPPGTGKTYTTLQLVKLFLTNQWLCQSSPVLIVSYTNHSLDQVLELILDFITTCMCDGDEKEAQKSIVRVGGGSESEKIQPLQLMIRTNQYKDKTKKLTKDINQYEKVLKGFKGLSFDNMLLDVGILNFSRLPQFILDKLLSDRRCKKNVEQLIMWETEIRKDIFAWFGIDKNSLKDIKFDEGLFMLRCRNLQKVLSKKHPKLMGMVKKENIRIEEISFVENHDELEWGCYLFVVNRIKNFVEEMEKHLLLLRFNFQAAKRVENRSRLLKSAKIVGMTTTGAVKYKTMVQKDFKPKIMIVEEAAHVLEAHVVASLTEHCQQMILIGDHKQLRPLTADNELGESYQLNISLMERLVQNGVAQNNKNWIQLKHQHRMRPEIARMVCPVIYEELENHPVVFEYPDVLGCDKNLFFVNHNHPDEKEQGSSSYYNNFEARYIIDMLKHFTRPGYYLPDKITIIVTYLAQKTRIDNMLKNTQLNGVRVSTVDGYQGEENDIIFLSLVRSNEGKHVGFLKTDNRVCVALSRARHGLFMIGNMSCLENASNTWKQINKILKETNSIGSQLPLTHRSNRNMLSNNSMKTAMVVNNCKTSQISPISKNRVMEVVDVSPSLPKTPKNGLIKLDCEHQRKFSPFQLNNAKVNGRLQNCVLKVTKNLKCGHQKSMQCHQFETFKCPLTSKRTFACGHEYQLPCSQNISGMRCSAAVTKDFPCGHRKIFTCHQASLNIKCDHCDKIPKDELVKLDCGHQRLLSPIQLNNAKVNGRLPNCVLKVTKNLKCGHQKSMQCHQFETYQCQKITSKKLTCGHVHNLPCARNNSKFKCSAAVTKAFPCGHQKMLACHKISSNTKCDICAAKKPVQNHVPTLVSNNVYVILACHHSVFIPPNQSKNNVVCTTVVSKFLPCGHFIINECHKIQSHQCDKSSMKNLKCGHQQTVPCTKNISNVECTTTVTKDFPCGHRKMLACHQISSNIKCDICAAKKPVQNQVPTLVSKNVLTQLACGHSVLIPPNQSKNYVVCTTVDSKFLPCGHFIINECHKIQSHQCDKSSMKNLKCGHQQTVPCTKNISNVECTTTVTKDLPCGHQQKSHCHQSPNSIKCNPCAITLPVESRYCDRDLVQSMTKLTIESVRKN